MASPVCTQLPCYQENCVFAQYSEDCDNLDVKQFHIQGIFALENSVYIQNLIGVCRINPKYIISFSEHMYNCVKVTSGLL
jgi:hypothetical protein